MKKIFLAIILSASSLTHGMELFPDEMRASTNLIASSLSHGIELFKAVTSCILSRGGSSSEVESSQKASAENPLKQNPVDHTFYDRLDKIEDNFSEKAIIDPKIDKETPNLFKTVSEVLDNKLKNDKIKKKELEEIRRKRKLDTSESLNLKDLEQFISDYSSIEENISKKQSANKKENERLIAEISRTNAEIKGIQDQIKNCLEDPKESNNLKQKIENLIQIKSNLEKTQLIINEYADNHWKIFKYFYMSARDIIRRDANKNQILKDLSTLMENYSLTEQYYIIEQCILVLQDEIKAISSLEKIEDVKKENANDFENLENLQKEISRIYNKINKIKKKDKNSDELVPLRIRLTQLQGLRENNKTVAQKNVDKPLEQKSKDLQDMIEHMKNLQKKRLNDKDSKLSHKKWLSEENHRILSKRADNRYINSYLSNAFFYHDMDALKYFFENDSLFQRDVLRDFHLSLEYYGKDGMEFFNFIINSKKLSKEELKEILSGIKSYVNALNEQRSISKEEIKDINELRTSDSKIIYSDYVESLDEDIKRNNLYIQGIEDALKKKDAL